MKKHRLVTLSPCPSCRLERDRDEYYTCWEVRCKEHGIVMDHGSLLHGAYSTATHRQEHELLDVNTSNDMQAMK